MAKYQDSALNKMKSTQASFLKDLTPVSQFPEKFDLQRILELLNTTNDINLQTKFFAALSAYLMFNKNTNFEDIIKSSAVYDKVYNVLAKGPPRKAADALNFLSALLYLDAEEGGTTQKRTLVLFAKNMIRVSGCLGAMTNMFTDCVMYHDTWKALCHCFAIVCSDCEPNQSYCTHLIPVCIRKCNQTNIDIFLVLQSLMMNHNSNIQLFLDSNGIAIFNRELLHYDKSLQLLTTVVQCSRASSLLLRETKLLDDLRDFLRLYGPGSQIGQKAMIILHHIESLSRGHEGHYNSRNITKEKKTTNIKRMDATARKVDNELDDTKTLIQNVMKEVYDYKQNGIGHLKKTASTVEVNSLFQGKFPLRNRRVRHKNILNKNSKLTSQHKQKSLQRNTATELSFSIFQNQPDHGHGSYINYHRNETMGLNFIDHSAETNKMLSSINIKKGFTDFSKTLSGEKPPVAPKEFKPIFSSTPKHVGESSYKAPLLDSPKTTLSLSRTSAQRPEIRQRTIKVQKRTPKIIERNKDKDLRNKSLSSRFFSAINGSCTTLIKTVATFFKKKDSILLSGNSTGSRSSRAQGNGSCSFSFLKYMQKRDAVLNKKIPKNKNYSEFSLETKSCETCEDTKVLRKKLIRDDHLKQTVKKLKLGINLFGCDFKKISRTMWPRESYMTPVVLYNLYRKLLLK